MNNTIDEVVEETYRELFVKNEKAIEKAVEELNTLEKQLALADDRFTPKTKEEWKEWLLKDE